MVFRFLVTLIMKFLAFMQRNIVVALKVKGPNLSEAINGTDPLKDNLPLKDPIPKMREKENKNAILTA